MCPPYWIVFELCLLRYLLRIHVIQIPPHTNHLETPRHFDVMGACIHYRRIISLGSICTRHKQIVMETKEMFEYAHQRWISETPPVCAQIVVHTRVPSNRVCVVTPYVTNEVITIPFSRVLIVIALEILQMKVCPSSNSILWSFSNNRQHVDLDGENICNMGAYMTYIW